MVWFPAPAGPAGACNLFSSVGAIQGEKMRTRGIAGAVLVVALVLGVSACGGDEDDSGGSGGGALTIKESPAAGVTRGPNGEKATPSSEIQLTDEQVAEIKKGEHTAVLVWPASSEWVDAVTRGAKAELERFGIKVVAETESVGAEYDAGKQRDDIETVLALKPDLMITLVADPVATASAYRKAVEQGTEIVVIDVIPDGFKHGRDYAAVVTGNLFDLGHRTADALAAAIGGKGQVGYVFHDADYYVTNQRDQAFKKTIEENYPDIEIVAEEGIADPAKAEEIANAMLTQHPDLDGIYVTWAEPAEGVVAALRAAGNKDTKVVTIDLSEPIALDMVRGGNVAALAADGAYELGRATAASGALGLLGEPAPEFAITSALTVTPDNVGEQWEKSVGIGAPQVIVDAAR
jgi:ribose transport system substrate-binding protein